MSGVTEVRVTRSRDVLEGQVLPVTGRLRRHGRLELLVVLPDGTSRLIPQAWTDDGDGGGGTGAAGRRGQRLPGQARVLRAQGSSTYPAQPGELREAARTRPALNVNPRPPDRVRPW